MRQAQFKVELESVYTPNEQRSGAISWGRKRLSLYIYNFAFKKIKLNMGCKYKLFVLLLFFLTNET